MTASRKFVCWIVWLPLLFMVGCQKKKASLPPKAQAPTVAVVLPDELPLAEAPEESPAPAEPAPLVQPPPKTKPKKPARNSTSTANAKKSNPPQAAGPAAPSAAAPGAPPQPSGTQTVASLRPPRTGASDSAPENAIAAAVPDAQVLHQKEDTARMVDATENALKGINRSLNDEEKSMRSQIQSYLQQSRKATGDGDFERAYNLAKKAQLLADALVKK